MLFVRRLGRVRVLGISDGRLRHTRRNCWHSRSCNGTGESGGGGRRVGRQIMGKNSSYSEELVAPILESVPVRWRSDLSRVLLRAPRGFGKFYPKGAQNVRPTGRSGTRLKKESSGGGGKTKGGGGGAGTGGGGGSGGGSQSDPERLLVSVFAPLAAVAILYSLMPDIQGQEITWQDFVNEFLGTGKCSKLYVINNKVARVELSHRAMDYDSDQQTSSYLKRQQEDGSVLDDGWGNAGTGLGGGGVERMDAMSDKRKGGGALSETQSSGHPSWLPASGVQTSTTSAASNHSSHFFFQIGSVDSFERKLEAAQTAIGIAPKDFLPVQYVTETSWTEVIYRFLPTIIIVGLWAAFMRGAGGSSTGGMSNVFKIGRSTAKRITKENVHVSFKDVAGVDEAKREIMEFVEFLKKPKRFTDLGAKIPKGAMLTGPPGTGKTLLAKATAGEAAVPFFSISGSDFIEMFVGVGPSRVRDLFKEARANAPCIVFIDEIDAVGRKRGRGIFTGGNDERENTLNALLVEMDGMTDRSNIVILAGTNRVDVLDPALMRPGRFDRQINVDLPDIRGRKQIFEVYLKGLNLKGKASDYSGRLAGLTPGFSGADIENICNEAAIVAARKRKKQIDMECFEAAADRVIGGLESSKIITPEEKRIVAYHEAGHAVAGWNLEHADPLLKVTIVPRGKGALGYAQYLPKEVFLRTREQIMDILCMALAGRASEEVEFGAVTTGASDDLRRVTQMVYQMITTYGMSENIGQLSFPKEESGGFPQDRLYSDATAQLMDEEAREIVEDAYIRTVSLIREKREQVKSLAELLLEKETINHDDIVKLLGDRPFASHRSYEEFVQSKLQEYEEFEEENDEEEDEAKESDGPEDKKDIPSNFSPA